jgi:hypothetical protein
MLNRLVLLAAVVGAGYLLWGQRDRIGALANNNLRIQGTWYQVDMDVDRKGMTPYHFSERFITRDDSEWGSYELPKNNVIEVMVANQLTVYELSFPDESNMIWSAEVEGRMTPVMHWRE